MGVSDHNAVAECARRVAAAIGQRDTSTLATLLDAGFVHRAPGGANIDAPSFLKAIAEIPGEIVSVTLDELAIDIVGEGALATGIQHARVRMDGQLIEERRGFVDWFVKAGDTWRIRVAVDCPVPPAGAA